jgi:hypothetical protein
MTKLSTGNVTKLNNMNRAASNVDLGTLLKTIESGSATQATEIGALQAGAVVSGSVLVYALHTNGSAVVINSGLGSIDGYVVQIYRSGSSVYGHYAAKTGGSITVMANASGSYLLLARDSIEYIVW